MRKALTPRVAWLIASVVSIVLCYIPASFVLFVLAMSLGFSTYTPALRLTALIVVVAAIGGVAYLIARVIKRGLAGE